MTRPVSMPIASDKTVTATRNLLVAAAAVWLLYTDLTVLLVRDYSAPVLTLLAIPSLLGLIALSAMFRNRVVRIDAGLALISAFVFIHLISGAASDFPDRAAEAIVSLAAEGAFIYLLVINALRSRQLLIAALWGAVLAVGLMGGLALANAATANSVIAFGGLAKLGPVDQEVAGGLRAAGPSVGPNYFAQVLIMPLSFAIAFTGLARSKVQKLAAVVCIFAIVGGVVLTYSRGGALGLAAVIGLSLVLLNINRKAAITLIAVSAIGLGVVNPSYVDRLISLSEVAGVAEGDASGSVQGRFVENLAAARMFADRPILGVGPANYPSLYNRYSADYPLYRDRPERTPHSLPLQIAAELGIAGLLVFGTIVGWLGWRLAGIARKDADQTMRMLAMAALIAIVGYLVASLFLHAAFFRFFWMLVALGGAIIGLSGPVGSTLLEHMPPRARELLARFAAAH